VRRHQDGFCTLSGIAMHENPFLSSKATDLYTFLYFNDSDIAVDLSLLQP
jgi:hypothetical protein